jgi:haloalkane dehalogenase
MQTTRYDFLPATHAIVVKEFVKALDLKDYILVGQDWGGPIGLWMWPNRIPIASRLS